MEYNYIVDNFLILIIFAIPLIAQLRVSLNYNKYLTYESKSSLTGFEVARKILDSHGLNNIHIVETPGTLSDHYDPSRKVLRLSHNVFHGTSISSMSIAAHECGHAIQDKDGYTFMRIRSFIYPIVNVATQFSYFIILIGIITAMFKLIMVGIALTGCGLIFQLVTLPVEFDASKRAKQELYKLNIASEEENTGVKKVLGAAAMTYVAGVLTSILQILRLLYIFNDRD